MRRVNRRVLVSITLCVQKLLYEHFLSCLRLKNGCSNVFVSRFQLITTADLCGGQGIVMSVIVCRTYARQIDADWLMLAVVPGRGRCNEW
jgi:hypothetical protein